VTEEDEAVAGMHEIEYLNSRLLAQEGERREGHGSTQRVDECSVQTAIAAGRIQGRFERGRSTEGEESSGRRREIQIG